MPERDVLDRAPSAYWLLDGDGTIRYANAAAHRTTRRAAGTLVGEPIWAAFPGAEAPLRALLARVLAGGDAEKLEVDARPLGEWFEIEAYRVSTGLALQSEVVTGRRQAERQLAETDRMLRLALDAAAVQVWEWVPATGAMRWWREIADESSEGSASPESLAGYLASVHPDDRAAVKEALDALLDAAAPRFDITYRSAAPIASQRWYRLRGTAERDDAGDVVRLVGTLRDITEERRLEVQLLRSQKLESVGRLAGGVAHDFNNLLTAMLGEIELARLDLAPDHPLMDTLTRLLGSVNRAGQLTAQLLAFARKQLVQPKVVSLNDITQDLEGLVRRLLREDVRLDVRLAADPWRVRIDPSQFEQVLMNLVVNAADAMPDGGTLTIETANVHLEARQAGDAVEIVPGDYVLVTVSDTGSGMSEETVGRIFEPFFTTKEAGKGTGLGLAICYGIVKQNHGYIWVYSEPGSGTVFKIYFPRSTDALSAAPRAATSESRGGTETVLLAEDEPMVREIAVRALEARGYRVLAAASGAEALALARAATAPVDLLVTDVIMPDMTGRELARQLSSRWLALPVLYVSGYTEHVIGERGVLEPGIDFLPKPYSPSVLAQRVRGVLDRRAGDLGAGASPSQGGATGDDAAGGGIRRRA